jgi:hypothetical protein
VHLSRSTDKELDYWQRYFAVHFPQKQNPHHQPPGSPQGGEFAPADGGGGGGKEEPLPKLTKTDKRAYEGEPVSIKTKLTKRETGKLGESIAAAYMRSQGYKDTRPINHEHENFPVDMIQDHELVEVKTGIASSTTPRWRATIGQPGVEETKWLKTASVEDKKVHNAHKKQEIMQRKMGVLAEYSKKVGKEFKGKTFTMIVNPDTKHADLYLFDGFHQEIRWTSELAKKSYVGSYHYE